MRIFIPRHISWWLFNMNISLGPITITMVQLVLLAIWAVICFAIWQSLNSQWIWTVPALILVLPVAIIFLIVTFFKMSELPLVPFLAKLIRTYFFDSIRKFQTCRTSVDPEKVLICKVKSQAPVKKIETKRNSPISENKEKLDKIEQLFQ